MIQKALLCGITQNNSAKYKHIKALPFLTKASGSIKDKSKIDPNKYHHQSESEKQYLCDSHPV